MVIAVTLQRLAEDATRFWTVEERLVLEALRRSKGSLEGASAAELARYVANLGPAGLGGVVNNVKGIYHELLFAQMENTDGDGVTARLFDATNHPGADVEFLVDGEVIRSVQLKAVASASHIREHLERYPGVQVLATDEVAAQVPGLGASGLSNAELHAEVEQVLGELPGDSLAEDMGEGVGSSFLVSAALAAGKALHGKGTDRHKLGSVLRDAAAGGVAASVLDTLLDTLA